MVVLQPTLQPTPALCSDKTRKGHGKLGDLHEDQEKISVPRAHLVDVLART
jgi:hypothetical protein